MFPTGRFFPAHSAHRESFILPVWHDEVSVRGYLPGFRVQTATSAPVSAHLRSQSLRRYENATSKTFEDMQADGLSPR